MPVRGNTFKIFVGNLSDRASGSDLRELFEQHGTVVEADVVKNYGFVHMEKEDEGRSAIQALNGHSLFGKVNCSQLLHCSNYYFVGINLETGTHFVSRNKLPY